MSVTEAEASVVENRIKQQEIEEEWEEYLKQKALREWQRINQTYKDTTNPFMLAKAPRNPEYLRRRGIVDENIS
jgi:5'-deoxynucleotidase YfbR-like HD superfamily hydrolase